MKIAVLHSSYEDSATPFATLDSVSDPSPYLVGHECLHFQIPKASAVRQVMRIASQDFDVAVNLCDGAWDDDRAGIEVVQTLERLNFPFTGAGSAFYDPTREAMKMACFSADVRFPAYVMFHNAGDVDRAVRKLRFPMLVKHPQGYGSAGILRSSLVSDRESLGRECARVSGEYGAALIEEFIAGREFTVMAAERRHEGEEAWALEPVEFLFPPDESFKHFDLKWKDYARMTTRPVEDSDLALRLREMSALTFAALNGSGYGRCDIRMDTAGALYMLEINPNCGLFYPEGEFGSGDFILVNDPAGHAGFLRHVIDCAFRRRDRAQRPWRIEYGRATGFGLFAARPVCAGEVLERYEEKPHTLVSRAHVERQWHGLKRTWFDRYAWPLEGDLHVLWSENPEGWRPLNHSCNPSAWLSGLDLVARRDLREGDEITTDYATYCGPSMRDFSCRCGAPECRGVIRGTDCLLPEVRARYAGHVSSYVYGAWQRAPLPALALVPVGMDIGVIAQRAWRCGEVITDLQWTEEDDHPGRHTLQTGPLRHAEPVPRELRFVNHSCSPSALFDLEAGVLRALRDLEPGDPLTCFYPASEWEMAELFTCACGSGDCLGVVRGAAQLPPEVLQRYVLTGVVRAKRASIPDCLADERLNSAAASSF